MYAASSLKTLVPWVFVLMQLKQQIVFNSYNLNSFACQKMTEIIII